MMIKDKLIEIMQDNLKIIYVIENSSGEILGLKTAAMAIYNYLVESGMMIGRKWKDE